MLYGVLFVKGRVVSCAQPKKKSLALHHEDLILLAHFVRNSQSWKQSEAFTPICLPHFEASGFVYCYVSYFGMEGGSDHNIAANDNGDDDQNDNESNRSEICWIALTLDSGSFKRCQSLRKRIEHQLQTDSLIESITQSAKLDPFSTAEIVHSVYGATLHPQVFAFYFNDIKRNQFVAPRPIKLYDTEHGEKALFRRLQHLQHHSHSTPSHPLYFQRTATDAAVCRLEEGHYEMYIILNPLVSKSDALDVLQRLTQWVLDHQKDLFLSAVQW